MLTIAEIQVIALAELEAFQENLCQICPKNATLLTLGLASYPPKTAVHSRLLFHQSLV